jgi:hypothetical protein
MGNRRLYLSSPSRIASLLRASMQALQAMCHLCYKAAMRAAALLLLVVSPAYACDWQVISDRKDSMTDQRVCVIQSKSAHLAIGVRGQTVSFVTGSAYRSRDGLQVRIDENAPILIGERARFTDSFESDARDALAQIRAGQRLRVKYLDYPAGAVEGDAPICNLPALIDSCR